MLYDLITGLIEHFNWYVWLTKDEMECAQHMVFYFFLCSSTQDEYGLQMSPLVP